MVDQIRKRLETGEPTGSDLWWAKRRLQVLEEWPEELTRQQRDEMSDLRRWIREYDA
jgi:hypothetical protein